MSDTGSSVGDEASVYLRKEAAGQELAAMILVGCHQFMTRLEVILGNIEGLGEDDGPPRAHLAGLLRRMADDIESSAVRGENWPLD